MFVNKWKRIAGFCWCWLQMCRRIFSDTMGGRGAPLFTNQNNIETVKKESRFFEIILFAFPLINSSLLFSRFWLKACKLELKQLIWITLVQNGLWLNCSLFFLFFLLFIVHYKKKIYFFFVKIIKILDYFMEKRYFPHHSFFCFTCVYS